MEIKKMNKKGMLMRDWAISFLIFMAVFSLLFISSSSFINEYGEGDMIDDNYRERYDKFNETSGEFETLFVDISDENSGLLQVVGEVFNALKTLVSITFGSVGTASELAEDFGEDMGIPSVVTNVLFGLVMSIIMVLFIFIIISAVNRSNKI